VVQLALKRPKWAERNFVTEVFIPSLFQRKAGKRAGAAPLFPKLKEGQVGITWIGHASFLIQTGTQNILVDPNWSNWLWVIRRVRHAGIELDHLPNIDLVLVTHAHFDHLDRRTLKKVARKQAIAVPKGVSPLVHGLGFEQVHEMSWWDHWKFGEAGITFTPAKHWGARRLTDRHREFGGFLIEARGRRIYHAGDTTYFDGFPEIGARLKPEIALMPIGAYQPLSFRDHHISPENALKAFVEMNAKTFVPMHWGTYRLSYEPMHEPPQRLMLEAAKLGILHQVKFLTEGMPQVF
jgi:L-ascorbate metabolism protein UlaG (beta-lactamase superfamily)